MSKTKAKPARKAGRPPRREGTERLTTTLPGGYLERLREIGDGSITAGIVRSVDAFTNSLTRGN